MTTVPTAPVLLCLGPGGVGKTTASAALALSMAQAGRRAVVLTIDPARRLADAMGVEGLTNEPQLLPGPWSGELWAAMLDPHETFEQLVREHSNDAAQAQRIIENRLFQNLTSSLSGTHEYMAVERLRALHHDPRFDVVIVDTPPARHAFDFLDSPSRLVRFIDHPLYRSILAPRRGVFRAVNLAAQLVVRTIGRVVGAELLADVIDFFAAFEGLDEGFRERADDVAQLLTSDETAFVLVTTARPDPLATARWIAEGLREREIDTGLLIANRLTPQHLGLVSPSRLDVDDPLDQNLTELSSFARREARLLDDLEEDLGHPPAFRIDDRAEPITDLAGLEAMSATFTG